MSFFAPLGEHVVIGGSGPSLVRTDTRRVPQNASIMRVNNFFLEENYHLGQRVDVAYFGGDKRAMRFYLATIRKVLRLSIYDIRASSSHNPRALKLAPPTPFRLYAPQNPDLARLVRMLQDRHQVAPLSGTYAAMMATECGAVRLYLSGIDLYSHNVKYMYSVPPTLRKVLKPHWTSHGYDEHLHSRDVDLHIFEFLERVYGVKLLSVSPASNGSQLFDSAPVLQNGEHLVVVPRKKLRIDDWERWAGGYPIGWLLTLRKLRSLIDRLRSK